MDYITTAWQEIKLRMDNIIADINANYGPVQNEQQEENFEEENFQGDAQQLQEEQPEIQQVEEDIHGGLQAEQQVEVRGWAERRRREQGGCGRLHRENEEGLTPGL